MELKVIVGQLCVTAVTITCVVYNQNHGILYLALGGLLASIGYPFVADLRQAEIEAKT